MVFCVASAYFAFTSVTGLKYNLTELRKPGALQNWNSFAQPIADDGTVGGEAYATSTTTFPCLWASTGYIELPKQNFPYGTVRDISANGIICGNLGTNGAGRRGAIWKGGQLTLTGNLPGYASDIVAWGVNASGWVVGHCYNSMSNREHAFLWRDGAMTDLGDLPGGMDDSFACDVNASGTIIGYSSTEDSWRPFLWQNGVLEHIEIPATFTSGYGIAVNEYGQILCLLDSATSSFGVLRDGHWVTGGSETGFSSPYGTKINDVGQVTGYLDDGNKPREPFFWTEETATLRILQNIEDADGWTDLTPLGLNNKGQISGWGFYTYDKVNNLRRKSGFRLDPVTTTVPPTTVTVVYGKKAAGDAQSLAALDSVSLRVCRFLVPNQSVDPVQVRVEANLPWRPMNLWLKASARAVNSGSYSWSLNLYDWERGLFDPATNVTAPLTTSVSSQETIAKGRIDRYVRASDNKVWGLLRVRSTGPVSTTLWCAEFDQAVWEAVPLP